MQFLSYIALTLTVLLGLLGLTAAPVAAAPLTETEPPWRVEIPNAGIGAPVELAERDTLNGKRTWTVPCDYSASLMRRGTNTTLFGHRDVCGGVFDNLENVEIGDIATFDARTYVVKERHIVVPEEVWPVFDYGDARLTLISCWPPGSTAQRLVIIAVDEGPSTRPAPSKDAGQVSTPDIRRNSPAYAGGSLSKLWKASALPIAIVSAGVLLSSR